MDHAADWIVSQPGILGGKPCIRGTRISVQLIREFFASGMSEEEFFEGCPHVPREGLAAALRYRETPIKGPTWP